MYEEATTSSFASVYMYANEKTAFLGFTYMYADMKTPFFASAYVSTNVKTPFFALRTCEKSQKLAVIEFVIVISVRKTQLCSLFVVALLRRIFVTQENLTKYDT